MNARGFVLALFLLVGIAAAHVVWVCLRIGAVARSQAAGYRAASLFDDAELSLREFVLDGQRPSLDRLESSRAQLHDLCGSHDDLEEWSYWEERWYNTYAQPLIQERQKVDAGQSTISQLHAFYLQRSRDRNTWGAHTFTMKSGETLTFVVTPKSRLEFGAERVTRQTYMQVLIAPVICLAGLVIAGLALRHISSLAKQRALSETSENRPLGTAG